MKWALKLKGKKLPSGPVTVHINSEGQASESSTVDSGKEAESFANQAVRRIKLPSSRNKK